MTHSAKGEEGEGQGRPADAQLETPGLEQSLHTSISKRYFPL